jgi:hypothetical protein
MGPPYIICNITGWARQPNIKSAILLDGDMIPSTDSPINHRTQPTFANMVSTTSRSIGHQSSCRHLRRAKSNISDPLPVARYYSYHHPSRYRHILRYFTFTCCFCFILCFTFPLFPLITPSHTIHQMNCSIHVSVYRRPSVPSPNTLRWHIDTPMHVFSIAVYKRYFILL